MTKIYNNKQTSSVVEMPSDIDIRGPIVVTAKIYHKTKVHCIVPHSWVGLNVIGVLDGVRDSPKVTRVITKHGNSGHLILPSMLKDGKVWANNRVLIKRKIS